MEAALQFSLFEGFFLRVFVCDLAALPLPAIYSEVCGRWECCLAGRRPRWKVDGGFVILNGSRLWTQPQEVLQVKSFQCRFPEMGLNG